ncbi:hypothetical protein Ciccas_007598 [Cichlidogyrus casuarinus]|uniref:Uncharacterized protein n=1 Tax=Cichlidogyrus casuarinus TaxID=1844966 RepID=A0ABD2Q2G7_9PLAT
MNKELRNSSIWHKPSNFQSTELQCEDPERRHCILFVTYLEESVNCLKQSFDTNTPEALRGRIKFDLRYTTDLQQLVRVASHMSSMPGHEAQFFLLAPIPGIISKMHNMSEVFAVNEVIDTVHSCDFIGVEQLNKFAWSGLEKASPFLFQLVRNIYLRNSDYSDLIDKLLRKQTIKWDEGGGIGLGTLRQVACDWINENLAKVTEWTKDFSDKRKLTILGLFPSRGTWKNDKLKNSKCCSRSVA